MPPAAVEPLTSDGLSASWLGNQANQLRIGDCFLAHMALTNARLTEMWGKEWSALPEEHAASTSVYEYLSSYLVYHYKTSANKFLELQSVKAIWGGLIYLSKRRFEKTTREETKVSAMRARARVLRRLLRAAARAPSPDAAARAHALLPPDISLALLSPC